jgi:hypothetical protein
MAPLQSLSMPSHEASLAAGVPAAQLSTRAPATQASWPVAAQAPTPQVVAVGT